MQSFEAMTRKDANGKRIFIEIPFDAKEVFGITKGTIFVVGRINDVEYRSRLLSRGKGVYNLILNKALRKSIGMKEAMIAVSVTMHLDNQASADQGPQGEIMGQIEMALSDMDIVTAIQNRRSIRKFTAQPVDERTLNTMIHAGLLAPTAKNKKPCHFMIVKDKEALSKLSQNNPYARMLADAFCGIIVCGDSNVEGMKEFLYADCAAAAQNILLCAHGLGLGAVWCGVAANSDWKKLLINEFGLPLKVEPIAVIALGYPDESKQIQERWDSGKIHFNTW